VIVTKTPLRLALFCGGTDLPAFYSREEGAALSITIDKYIYTFVHETKHTGIKTMLVDDIQEVSVIDDMKHSITRETLRHFGVKKELTISSISDIMARGSGLGSSSSFTVGLINAMCYMMWGMESASKVMLADLACHVEMEMCGYPVGKQDQYAASFGGINYLRFLKGDGRVVRENSGISKPSLYVLKSNLLLLYTGKERSANDILQKQSVAFDDPRKFTEALSNRDRVHVAAHAMLHEEFDTIGHLFDESWESKKKFVPDISGSYFDSIYATAKGVSGTIGGKLVGAGGGGFFLFYTLDREALAAELLGKFPECRVYDFKFTESGSTVVLID
jgi:D-glycero-alpha-D-manno-heptose-7-phosphate kinase